MEALSQRQHQILAFIATHTARHDRPPTNRDIGRHIGTASTGLVDYHLAALASKGYIHRDTNTSRGLRLTPAADPTPRKRIHHVPVRGLIAAGAPIDAISDPNDSIELSGHFAAQDAYALRVRGTSMIEDLIDGGDLVVISPAQTASNGDLVVALLTTGPTHHGPATLKRYFQERDRIRLQPANQTMKPLYVRPQDLHIQGKVIALIRKL